MKTGGNLFSTIRFCLQPHGKRAGSLKILITGASGLVGMRLTEAANRAGHETFTIDNQHQIDSPSAYHIDLRHEQDMIEIMKLSSPDVVVHLASITDVDLCEHNPKLANEVNTIITRSLAQECSRAGSHLIYVSTDYVFDGKLGNYREEDQPNPINTYGLSKLRGEEATRNASEKFSIARTSVVYGWGRKFRPNFGSWVYTELEAGRPTRIVKDQYCSPTLDSQLARMLLEVAEKRIPGTIHLAGASKLNRYEFALKIANKFQMDRTLIVPIDSRSTSWFAKRPLDSSLNVEKAQKLLTNKPENIELGLNEFARWIMQH
jgi:dTDP-4-dehydrorhamnose reductase